MKNYFLIGSWLVLMFSFSCKSMHQKELANSDSTTKDIGYHPPTFAETLGNELERSLHYPDLGPYIYASVFGGRIALRELTLNIINSAKECEYNAPCLSVKNDVKNHLLKNTESVFPNYGIPSGNEMQYDIETAVSNIIIKIKNNSGTSHDGKILIPDDFFFDIAYLEEIIQHINLTEDNLQNIVKESQMFSGFYNGVKEFLDQIAENGKTEYGEQAVYLKIGDEAMNEFTKAIAKEIIEKGKNQSLTDMNKFYYDAFDKTADYFKILENIFNTSELDDPQQKEDQYIESYNALNEIWAILPQPLGEQGGVRSIFKAKYLGIVATFKGFEYDPRSDLMRSDI